MVSDDDLTLRGKGIFLMQKGIPNPEVCLRLGKDSRTILQWRTDANIVIIKQDWEFLKKEAISMLSYGIPINEVARRLAINQSSIRTWKKKSGVKGPSGRHSAKKGRGDFLTAAYTFQTMTDEHLQSIRDYQFPEISGKVNNIVSNSEVSKTRDSDEKSFLEEDYSSCNGDLAKFLESFIEFHGSKKTRHLSSYEVSFLRDIIESIKLQDQIINLKDESNNMMEKELIHVLLQSGLSATKISDKYGFPYNKITLLRKEIAMELLSEGVPAKKVSKQLGIRYKSALKWRSDAGLSPRVSTSIKDTRSKEVSWGICRVCECDLFQQNTNPSQREGSGYAPQYICKSCYSKEVRERKAGLSPRAGQKTQSAHNARSAESKEQALRMVREGHTLREVEAKLEIPYGTIYAWARKAGLQYPSQRKGQGTKERSHIGSNCKVCTSVLTMENTNPSQRKGPGKSKICKSCHNEKVQKRKSRKNSRHGNSKSHLKPEAMRMIREGKKGTEVARLLGVNKDTVRKWRRKEGLSGKRHGGGNSKLHLKLEAVQLIREGHTGAEVARILGVHKDTVRQWRKSEGLSGKQGGSSIYSNEDKNNVIDLLRENKSLAEISRLTNISTTTISKWKKVAIKEGFLMD